MHYDPMSRDVQPSLIQNVMHSTCCCFSGFADAAAAADDATGGGMRRVTTSGLNAERDAARRHRTEEDERLAGSE